MLVWEPDQSAELMLNLLGQMIGQLNIKTDFHLILPALGQSQQFIFCGFDTMTGRKALLVQILKVTSDISCFDTCLQVSPTQLYRLTKPNLSNY